MRPLVIMILRHAVPDTARVTSNIWSASPALVGGSLVMTVYQMDVEIVRNMTSVTFKILRYLI